LPCSLLAWSNEGDALAISGVVRRGDEQLLKRLISAQGVAPAAARLDLQSFDGPYCEVLDAFRPILAGVNAAPAASVLGTLPLARNERLVIRVDMPAWPAHLYVAYFDKSRNVAQLVPSRRMAPGEQFRVGEPSPGFEGFLVDEPFGTDLAVVIATEVPLFGPDRVRPMVESQASYLKALTEALAAHRAANRRVLARALVVETVAQRRP
jgi:hypothetical protein